MLLLLTCASWNDIAGVVLQRHWAFFGTPHAGKDDLTPLGAAVRADRLDVVKKLFERGLDVNSEHERGYPLVKATHCGVAPFDTYADDNDLAILQFLLDNKASPPQTTTPPAFCYLEPPIPRLECRPTGLHLTGVHGITISSPLGSVATLGFWEVFLFFCFFFWGGECGL